MRSRRDRPFLSPENRRRLFKSDCRCGVAAQTCAEMHLGTAFRGPGLTGHLLLHHAMFFPMSESLTRRAVSKRYRNRVQSL